MVRVTSEVGRLRRALVHEPGGEVDLMVPGMLEQLLFDDIRLERLPDPPLEGALGSVFSRVARDHASRGPSDTIGAVLTALVVIGRAGSAMTAEIGIQRMLRTTDKDVRLEPV